MNTDPPKWCDTKDEAGSAGQTDASVVRHLSILAEASRLLASSLDYEVTLNAIAQAVVPKLADWCIIDLANEQGGVERLTVAHADPGRVAWAKELQQRYPPREDRERGVQTVLRTGKSIYVPEFTDEMIAWAARDAEELKLLQTLGLRSALLVPLTARGRTLGVLTFVNTKESARIFSAEDRQLADDLAQHAAIAVDNARLYKEAQSAIKQHQDAEDRLAALTEASGVLLGTLSLDELLPLILNLSERLFSADAYALWRVDPKTAQWSIACHMGLSSTFTKAVLPWKIKISPSLEEPLAVEDVEADDTLSMRYQAHKKEGIRSLLVLPLRARGYITGTLAFYYHDPHTFSQTDIRVAGAIANFAAAAIGTTQLYEEQARLKNEAQSVERRQRRFLRDVLGSVTEGKLFLCSGARELPKRLKPFGEAIRLAPDSSLRPLRNSALSAAERLGFPEDRQQDLVTAVGEAAINAVAHAGGGKASIYTDGANTVQVWIEDRGQGIDMVHLPRATLEKGYTTAGTLGHGMKIMLSMADRLWLMTGATGTKVVLEQDRISPQVGLD